MRYGNFETTTMLGRGGMGVVWRARHDSGEDVALKVVHPVGDLAKALRSLRREVQAIAALNHRGIVHVLDMGESDAQGEGWFAMEVAEGGTFEESSVSDFPELARLLFDVLDALGYAHARGIIHRDIKPSNILLAANPSGGWRCVLTDFGIAHIALGLDQSLEERTRATAGTPAYMAPEQFDGDWRNYGPWTDLYALGCLAFELLTGRPPFVGQSALETAMQHISDDIPTPVPMFEAPAGLTGWLRRMTQKDPADRFRCAADASWGLVQVIGGDPRFTPAGTIAGKAMARGTVATMTYDAFVTQSLDREEFSRVLQRDANDLDRAMPVVQPPVPYHVVEPTETHDRTLFGAGLNLFGLRQSPLVGRVEEREVLWSALRRACNEGLQTLLLQGEVGIGKSKLVQWLSMRAEEVGAAHVVTVHHSETGSGAHGMAAALAANLGLQGLRGRALARGVEVALSGLVRRTGVTMPDLHERVAEFAQFLVAEPIEGYPQVTFENPRQRYSALTWIMALMSMDRPVLLAVEDGNWAWDTLGFVRHLTEFAPHLRIMALIVMEPQIACGITRTHRQALMEWPHTTTLNLGALPTREHEALVRAVAPLDRTAAARVVAATNGRPGQVMHVISDLIDRHQLTPGAAGYLLSNNTTLSHSANKFWLRHLSKLCSAVGGDSDATMGILEISAAMGGAIDPDQVQRVAAELGLDTDIEQVFVTSFELGIMGYDDLGWSFSSAEYQAETRRLSQESGRWSLIHRVCAALVQDDGDLAMPASERRYVHLDMAGAEEEAAQQLAQAVEDHLVASAYERAGVLADELERRLAMLGAAPDDRRRIRAASARLDVMRFTGRLNDAIETASGMERRVATCADPFARADALRSMANVKYLAGDYVAASQLFDRAFTFAKGDDLLLAKLYHGAAWFHSNHSRVEAAFTAYNLSVDHARAAGSVRDVAWGLHGIAELQARQGEASGRQVAEEARDTFAAAGSRTGWALAVQVLAEFERLDGDYREAERLYVLAADTLHHVGSIVEAMVRGRLAVLYYVMGDNRAALAQARAAREAVGHGMSLPARLYMDLILMTLETSEDRRREHREIARGLIARTGFKHPDFDLFDLT